MKSKSYQDILSEVKAKNPDIKMQDAQKAASAIFKTQKDAQDKNPKFVPPVIKANPISSNNQSVSASEVDAAINAAGVNRNSILSIARNFDPNFTMVIDHWEGVNAHVYLDGPCRVPESGFYKIFLVKPKS